MRYPQSANRGALLWPAACILLEPGRFAFPNNVGAIRRAGVALDLAAARRLRLAGEKIAARERLEFCRDARRYLTGGSLP